MSSGIHDLPVKITTYFVLHVTCVLSCPILLHQQNCCFSLLTLPASLQRIILCLSDCAAIFFASAPRGMLSNCLECVYNHILAYNNAVPVMAAHY
jgi:hypothetical protein